MVLVRQLLSQGQPMCLCLCLHIFRCKNDPNSVLLKKCWKFFSYSFKLFTFFFFRDTTHQYHEKFVYVLEAVFVVVTVFQLYLAIVLPFKYNIRKLYIKRKLPANNQKLERAQLRFFKIIQYNVWTVPTFHQKRCIWKVRQSIIWFNSFMTEAVII